MLKQNYVSTLDITENFQTYELSQAGPKHAKKQGKLLPWDKQL